MTLKVVSLEDPNSKYLSCKPSEDGLLFNLVDLDPSDKFFKVSL